MRVCIIGLNHRTAPVELRERAAIDGREVGAVLNTIISHHAVREAVLLSTCNRVEFTLVTHDPDASIALIHEWFAEKTGMPLEIILPNLYSHTMDGAIRHLFSVAAGLDSLILGEPQILGQVKSAYELALEAETAGHILHRLYQATFSAAKRVRTDTDIGRQAINVSACAVELAKHIFGELNGKTVMLIGAGEMAELAARHFRSNGIRDVLVANRSLDRATKLAQQFDGHALTLEQLDLYLDAADIILSSTGASTHVLLPDPVAAAMIKRSGRPIFMVDIAVPRDIDPRIGEFEGVYLYDIDDLQQVVDVNLDSRKKEAELGRQLLDQDAIQFLNWLKALETVPLIRSIQERTETMRREELGKAWRYLKGLDDEQMAAVDRFSRALMKRFTHPALKTLKVLPDDMEGDLLMGATRYLFDLKPKPTQRMQETDENTTG